MTARGKMEKLNGTWYYKVRDSTGKTVLTDNCDNMDAVMEACRFDVAAVQRLERAGHHIQYSWAQIARAYPKYPGGNK